MVLEVELIILFRDHPLIEVFGFAQLFLFFHSWVSLETTRDLFFPAVADTCRLTLFDHTPAGVAFSILFPASLRASAGRSRAE